MTTINQTTNRTSPKNFGDSDHEVLEKPKGRMRIWISLLGLIIAAVNCYAQASFCLAIVEMVVPSDYEPIPSILSHRNVISNKQQNIAKSANHTMELTTPPPSSPFALNTVQVNEQQSDGSCPIQPEYRRFYDDWRFESPSNDSHGNNYNNSEQQVDNSSNNQAKSLDLSNRFDWNARQQGFLLAAAAVGMAPLQIIGGRLAEVYGPKWVLLASCAGTALTNLTIPMMAHWGFIFLLLNRFLMGMSQGGMEPGVMCLLANWLTPSEVGFFISMLLFAICIGGFFGSLLSSLILTTASGWPMTHYTSGLLNLLAAVIWYQFASNKPSDSIYITREESKYIEKLQQKQGRSNKNLPARTFNSNKDLNQNKYTQCNEDDIAKTNTIESSIHDSKQDANESQDVLGKPTMIVLQPITTPTNSPIIIKTSTIIIQDKDQDSPEVSDEDGTPWRAILSTPAVWAFIICKVSVRWTADILSLILPMYLANVLHLSIKLNGFINSLSTALFALFSFVAAYLFSNLVNSDYNNNNNRNQEDYDPIDNQDQQQQQQRQQYRQQRLSKTNLRKLAQSFASFGSAIAIFMMTTYACNLTISIPMLLLVSFCLVTGTGGELQIPYDMTSIYPGTLHGLACTLSVSGWLAPSLVGLILGDQPNSGYRWSIVWYMTATINFLGGLVFVLFADASPRNFKSKRKNGRLNECRETFIERDDNEVRLNDQIKNNILKDGINLSNDKKKMLR